MSLRERLDPVVRRFGFYTAYTLDEAEFIGTVEINTSNVFREPENMNPPFVMEHDLYRWLEVRGWEKPPTFAGIQLAAAKRHPGSGRVHDVSLRKIDPENERKQYHLHYWLERDGEGYTAQIAVHREFRPDVCILEGETLREAYNRLQTHYEPEWGTSEYEQGEAPAELTELVA